MSHKIKAILNNAGIDATAHDLRDSFVSHLIYLAYPIEDVSKMAGHSSVRVTQVHYVGQFEERQRQMITDLGQHFTRQINPPKTGTQNRDKTRSKVPNPAQYNDSLIKSKRPISRREKGLPTVARDGIEPPTHGFSVHVPLVVKYKKGQGIGAGV